SGGQTEFHVRRVTVLTPVVVENAARRVGAEEENRVAGGGGGGGVRRRGLRRRIRRGLRRRRRWGACWCLSWGIWRRRCECPRRRWRDRAWTHTRGAQVVAAHLPGVERLVVERDLVERSVHTRRARGIAGAHVETPRRGTEGEVTDLREHLRSVFVA